jgi:hypothetical protein
MLPEHLHLNIGSLLFEGLDQIDQTGPFEVLSRIPNVTHRIYARLAAPVRDLQACASRRMRRSPMRHGWTSCTSPAGAAKRC